MNGTQNWWNTLSEFEHSSDSARQSLLSLTNGWTFDTCLSCFTMILLVNEKKNQPIVHVRTTYKELVVKYSPTCCYFFSEINFIDWNLIRVAVHMDFTICLFAWLCFKEWNGFRNFHYSPQTIRWALFTFVGHGWTSWHAGLF